MPDLELSAAANLVHSRRDLPQPTGISINRDRVLTIYLRDRPGFDAWQAVLEDPETSEGEGWRSCTGWLSSARYPERVRTVLTVLTATPKGTKE